MDFCSSYNEIACYKFYVYILYILYLILFTPFYLTFNILLLHTFFTQDGRTPAELAQSRGYRDSAKLLIDEGMYFIIYIMKTSFSLCSYIFVELFYVMY